MLSAFGSRPWRRLLQQDAVAGTETGWRKSYPRMLGLGPRPMFLKRIPVARCAIIPFRSELIFTSNNQFQDNDAYCRISIAEQPTPEAPGGSCAKSSKGQIVCWRPATGVGPSATKSDSCSGSETTSRRGAPLSSSRLAACFARLFNSMRSPVVFRVTGL